MKREYFGTDDVEIKSNWLRVPKEKTSRYLEKYNLKEERLKDFVDEFYKIISEMDLMLIASIVDKVHMQEDYKEPWYAPTIAYEILLQRIVQEVKYPNSVSVTIDDMDGATPKKRQYKLNLKRQHQRLKQYGSSLRKGLDFSVLKNIRFINSAFSHHIQVADLIAYNVFRQFYDYGENWEDKANRKLPTYKWFNILLPKFRQNAGRVQGYGVIKMPLRTRVPWSLPK